MSCTLFNKCFKKTQIHWTMAIFNTSFFILSKWQKKCVRNWRTEQYILFPSRAVVLVRECVSYSVLLLLLLLLISKATKKSRLNFLHVYCYVGFVRDLFLLSFFLTLLKMIQWIFATINHCRSLTFLFLICFISSQHKSIETNTIFEWTIYDFTLFA